MNHDAITRPLLAEGAEVDGQVDHQRHPVKSKPHQPISIHDCYPDVKGAVMDSPQTFSSTQRIRLLLILQRFMADRQVDDPEYAKAHAYATALRAGGASPIEALHLPVDPPSGGSGGGPDGTCPCPWPEMCRGSWPRRPGPKVVSICWQQVLRVRRVCGGSLAAMAKILDVDPDRLVSVGKRFVEAGIWPLSELKEAHSFDAKVLARLKGVVR